MYEVEIFEGDAFVRDKGIFVVCVAVPLLGALCAVGLSASARFVFHHHQGETFAVTRDGAIVRTSEMDTIGAPRPTPSDVVEESLPRVEMEDPDHDFGLMDPLTMGAHTFVIRNVGTGPLRLQQGPTSCKCTLSRVEDSDILPGEYAEVRLEWNTGRDRLYSHEAVVYTNDPQRKAVHLRIRGVVRMRIAADPPGVRLGQIQPEQVGSGSVVLYSQIWDAFEVVQSDTSAAGYVFDVEPLAAAQLEDYDATAAYRLTIRSPAGLPRGGVTEWMRFRIEPTAAASLVHERVGDGDAIAGEFEELEVPVEGEVLGRLAVFSKDITAEGVVDFGPLPRGRGATKRLLVKVRDAQSELPIRQIDADPGLPAGPHGTLPGQSG